MHVPMNCPKCGSAMEKVIYAAVEVDRCTSCRGIWFDAMEREDLKEVRGSQAIDVGDPALGRHFNKIDRIACPVCSTQLIRMVDAAQPHIWFESCSVCYGAFFDAGEFTDYKEETYLDRLRALVARERK